jgi:hypothetical protein
MIQSDIMTYLYDPLVGGPPRAYECKIETPAIRAGVRGSGICGAVTRTLSGMRSHQRSVHGFTPQAKLPIKENTDADAKTALV